MIILDTNIVSELMRQQPSTTVVDWLNLQNPQDCYLTSISVAEILYGIGRLPAGQRQRQLASAFAEILEEDFADRVLAFDEHAAVLYAELVVQRESLGQPISHADAQIAAICLRHQAELVTRNVRDFRASGLVLINPWDFPSGNLHEERAVYTVIR